MNLQGMKFEGFFQCTLTKLYNVINNHCQPRQSIYQTHQDLVQETTRVAKGNNTTNREYNTRQHEYNTTENETTRVQHDRTRDNTSTTRPNTSTKEAQATKIGLYIVLFVTELYFFLIFLEILLHVILFQPFQYQRLIIRPSEVLNSQGYIMSCA